MLFEDYASSLSFNIWQPDSGLAGDHRLAVPRRSGPDAKLVELPRAAADFLNVALPPGFDSMHEMAAPLCGMARMSTFAVGALINRAVATMPAGHSYVNVGTWAGFSLRAGMLGNPDRTCVGVDDFSMFSGPRDSFHEWFDPTRSESHHFHEMDYRDYFARVHEGPIGVYFYDGDHTYEHQLLGLQTAEPFFGDECIVLVDDTNWVEPYEATRDFIADSEREYTVLLDEQTTGNAHPTFWNGLLIFKAGAGTRSAPPANGGRAPQVLVDRRYDPVRFGPDAPLVSLVLRDSRSSPARLGAAIEAALGQRWASLEVLVADEHGRDETEELVAGYAERVAYVSGESALARAIDRTRGDYVALADAEDSLLPSAVRIGLAFPRVAAFNAIPTDRFLQGLARFLDAIGAATAVVPRGSRIALVNGQMPVPAIDNGLDMTPFLDPATDPVTDPFGDDAALERLAGTRETGTTFLAIGWRSFDWLERFPRFRDELERGARRVLENDDVVVFDLS